jgi:hypothetical protein
MAAHAVQKAEDISKMAPISTPKMAAANTWWCIYMFVVIVAAIVFAVVNCVHSKQNGGHFGEEGEEEEEGRILELTDANFEEERMCKFYAPATGKIIQFYKIN